MASSVNYLTRRTVTHASWIGLLALSSIAGTTPPAARHGEDMTAAFPSLRPFVVRHAHVFDGQRLISAEEVLVEGGKIREVGKGLKAPLGTEEIDARGDTLLPGLIDSHTHDWGDSAKQAILFGVTTELNMGAPPQFVETLRRAEAAGKALDSADLRSAGNVVTPPKGHGTEYGLPVPTLTGAQEAQAFVDARLAEGSDYIKIILEDGHVCHLEFTRLSDEDLAAVVVAAHKRGKLAVGHISSQEDARRAISAGADGIAHLFSDGPPRAEVISLLRRRHAFAITTLTAIQSGLGTPSGTTLLTDRRLLAFLSPEAQAHMKEPIPFKCTGELANAFAAAKRLRDAGVPILAGTDAPAPGSWNGASLHGELELLVRAGLSPSDALAAATSVPASTFRLSDRGRIAPGLRADLLLVHGDPTREIKATRDIVAVWKAGFPVERGRAASPTAK
ncbi:MAG TPA: amidohydrolase family protein [Vicinamibacteria bacterium]|nr:amidohydrolase family protein [Vicinamibacteria bacterium]